MIKTGRGLVTVEGEPGEILLHASGRDAARVELHGEPADVAALKARRGGSEPSTGPVIEDHRWSPRASRSREERA